MVGSELMNSSPVELWLGNSLQMTLTEADETARGTVAMISDLETFYRLKFYDLTIGKRMLS